MLVWTEKQMNGQNKMTCKPLIVAVLYSNRTTFSPRHLIICQCGNSYLWTGAQPLMKSKPLWAHPD